MSSLTTELLDQVASYSADPRAYVEFAFPWGQEGTILEDEELRTWQGEVLDDIGAHLQNPATRFQPCQIAVASGHGIGKSGLIGMIVSWALDTCEDCKVIVTANTEEQLRGKTWPEVLKWRKLAVTADWWQLGASVIASKAPDHGESWQARLTTWSKTNTEAFAGMHNKGKRIVLVMDEGSAIDDKVYEVAEGALTDENTEIIWIVFGNPTRASGRFRELFRRLMHRWKTRHIDSRTVEGTNKALFDRWVEDYGEDSDFVKVRVRGIFPSLSQRQYISEADVDAAYGRHLTPDQYQFAPKILTLDNAWEGDDETAIGLRQGLHFQILRTIPKNDNDGVIADILARLEDEHKADAVFIDGGYGTGVASFGRMWNRHWQLVWFGGEAHDPGDLNKRASMWREARDWLKAGGRLPEDPMLRDELISPESIPRDDGKLRIEAKKDLKARGLTSGNRADALILSFAFPVAAKPTAEEVRALSAMMPRSHHGDGLRFRDNDPSQDFTLHDL